MDSKYIIGTNRNLETGSNKDGKDLEEDSEHIEHLENEGSPGKSSQGKIKFQWHWRRFWCCYLIAGIIFLAIILPVL